MPTIGRFVRSKVFWSRFKDQRLPPLHLFSWFGFDEGKACGICGSVFGPLRGVSSKLQRSLNADGAELHWVVCVSRGWRTGNQVDVFRCFSCWILPHSTIVRHLHMLCKLLLLLLLIGAESLQHLRHPQDNVRWDPMRVNAAGPRCGAESYASPCRGPTRHFQSPFPNFPTQPDMQPDMTLDSFFVSPKNISPDSAIEPAPKGTVPWHRLNAITTLGSRRISCAWIPWRKLWRSDRPY